ncbi:hypothetical protein Mgra_00003128 [Meloidogyne graminicola]|uniref:Uncharacterized protein n=1 Tax=Meloidogyne graminicola TaxID=189291 RepID=A0A8S9ZW66_9BILA|nr:hypothetical protein Mgra_00003128 [Meloidogyne graminicola]
MSEEKRKRKRSSDEDLSSNLMEEYWKVRRQYERKIAVQGLKSFEESRNVSKQMSDFNYILQIPEYTQMKDNQTVVLRRAETGFIVNKCPIIPLEHVESTPPMQYWTHTETNVIVSK